MITKYEKKNNIKIGIKKTKVGFLVTLSIYNKYKELTDVYTRLWRNSKPTKKIIIDFIENDTKTLGLIMV